MAADSSSRSLIWASKTSSLAFFCQLSDSFNQSLHNSRIGNLVDLTLFLAQVFQVNLVFAQLRVLFLDQLFHSLESFDVSAT